MRAKRLVRAGAITVGAVLVAFGSPGAKAPAVSAPIAPLHPHRTAGHPVTPGHGR